mmetsp:Transcript_12771/g.47174  ORF Transcript_12771/g.47174 Transcript_12771/m.47174 type:complete len:383 (+) Transcript_12771:804-1952(+)|eukprot:scaffold24_cov245-Pinguiococcus_pyrenoidosus.AAC.27
MLHSAYGSAAMIFSVTSTLSRKASSIASRSASSFSFFARPPPVGETRRGRPECRPFCPAARDMATRSMVKVCGLVSDLDSERLRMRGLPTGISTCTVTVSRRAFSAAQMVSEQLESKLSQPVSASHCQMSQAGSPAGSSTQRTRRFPRRSRRVSTLPPLRGVPSELLSVLREVWSTCIVSGVYGPLAVEAAAAAAESSSGGSGACAACAWMVLRLAAMSRRRAIGACLSSSELAGLLPTVGVPLVPSLAVLPSDELRERRRARSRFRLPAACALSTRRSALADWKKAMKEPRRGGSRPDPGPSSRPGPGSVSGSGSGSVSRSGSGSGCGSDGGTGTGAAGGVRAGTSDGTRRGALRAGSGAGRVRSPSAMRSASRNEIISPS